MQKRARNILKGSKRNKLIEIRDTKDSKDLDFMVELFKTHPNAEEKGILKANSTIKVFKGKSKQNTPCYFISIFNNKDPLRFTSSQGKESSTIEDISYMKCINEVAVKFSHNMIEAMQELKIDVRMFIDLVVSIADHFPFNKPKILKLILKMIPHSALHVQIHAIFLKILFYILSKMPYYEEEILEAVLTRFIQIDVSIKSKQLAFKRHFTSHDLKADVYLYYLIQHFKHRISTIEEDSIPSLQKKPDLTNSGDVKMEIEDKDSILDSSDEEETFEDSEIAKNKIDRFCDMLLRLFENNVLPFSESHYPQYCFLYVCSINQMFLQKIITLFVLRAFNANDNEGLNQGKNDQAMNRVTNINYLCSLLATSGKEIIPIKILLESLDFLVKFFKRKFHSKIKISQFDAESNNSEGSEFGYKKEKGKMRLDDKLFYISVVQGLTHILTFKIPEIESQNPSLLTKILKLILNNEHKAALYNQTQVLQSFLDAMKTHKIQPKYIRRLNKLLKEQKNFLRYKKDLFNRIKRKMPFGTPLFLNESGSFFKNINSHLPNNQIQVSINKTLLPPDKKFKPLVKKVMFEEAKVQKSFKNTNYEDKEFNAAMIASFGIPGKSQKNGQDIRKSIFGKLGRSLSVDFKHKQKAYRRPSKDSMSKNGNELQKVDEVNTMSKPTEVHFHLEDATLVEFENNSDGYASDKNTDVASIELLDESNPWTHRRKNRSRNRNRRLKRLFKSNL